MKWSWLWLLWAACSSTPRPADSFLGDTHATVAQTDAGSVRSVPPLSAAEARRGFEQSIVEDEPWATVIFANRLATVGALDPSQQRLAEQAVDALDEHELVAVWAELDAGHAPAGAVALRRAKLARHLRDDSGAALWAERAGADAAHASQAQEILAELRGRTAADPTVIAVLVPLSGPHAAIGREIVAGISIAWAQQTKARLVLLDTAGQASGAAAAVDAAVYEHHALAILGPVGQRESRAAAGRAAQLGVPIALLASAEGSAARDAGIFRLWPSGEWFARAAAREAVRRGFDTVAVLAPRDEYGRAQAEAFASEVRDLGARVVAHGDYDPTGTDLEPDIRSFLGLDPATNERLRRHLRRFGKAGWKTFSPDVRFDLLFIPDDYQRAALVASYLPFFNVELRTSDRIDPLELRAKHGGRVPSLVQLLGTPGWHHPGLLPRGGAAVQGALIVDVCAGPDDAELATDGAAEFSRRFIAHNGRPPTAVASQAYDAARLVLLARSRSTVRAGWIAELAAAQVSDGACGRAAVGAGGEIERDLIVLRVDQDGFAVEERW